MNILKCEFIGEAMYIKKILLFLLLMPSIIFSQDLSDLNEGEGVNVKALSEMSDKEINAYWGKAQERGYTLEQLKTLARAQGASESELMEFEKRIKEVELNDLKVEESDLEKTQNELTSIFGLQQVDELEEDEPSSFVNLGVFGSEFFNNPNIDTSPQLNIATPKSYELGPGDELAISIWGAAENDYISKISREGYLKIERIGPVYLSGLSISEAKIKLLSLKME